MSLRDVRARLDPVVAGDDAYRLISDLFPLRRSITGEGVRRTLEVVGTRIPLQVHEVPTGTPVLDWTVPKEWNVHEAWVKGPDGRTVVDLAESNLNVVSYSAPVHRRLDLEELRPHLFSLPDRPDLVPYRTSYYSETWGFCLRHRDLERLPAGEYEVRIDASLEDGSLTYGEAVVPGRISDEEVLISTHVCHPSLANDNLSGIALATLLAEQLGDAEPRHTHRFLFVPGTIGSITWLAHNPGTVGRVRHGLVITALGDPGPLLWKRSRRGSAGIDRVVELVLARSGLDHRVIDYYPYGYDERQYCSPGFDLPVGRLSRSMHGEYPEYHTSGDDLGFVRPDKLGESLAVLLEILDVVERDGRYRNLQPYGEPQLGRRGLYRSVGGAVDSRSTEMGLLWVLSLSDGSASLLDVAQRSGLPFDAVFQAAQALEDHGLLERLD